MKIAEKLSSLYKSGVTAHELRLSRADDSEHCVTTFEGNKIKNPFMEDTRPKIDRFLGSLHPDMLEKEALQADAERSARKNHPASASVANGRIVNTSVLCARS